MSGRKKPWGWRLQNAQRARRRTKPRPEEEKKKGAPALQALVPSAHLFVGCGAPVYRKAHPSNAGRSHWSRHVCWSIACHARHVRLTHCGNQMNMRFVAKRNCLFTSASLLTSFLLSGFVTTGIKFGIGTPPTNWSTRTHAQAGCQPTSLRLIKSLGVFGELSFARFTSCIDVWG